MFPRMKTIALLGIGALSAPAFGANPAHPGTVNYIEGAAFLEGKQLDEKSIGSADLDIGEVLSTRAGKAEMLLTPGVFLRLDENSAVKMISPDMIPTQVELERGRASVEGDELYPQNNLEIADAGVLTRLVKTGYYEFNADHPTVMVFRGEAAVDVGDGKFKRVKDHHEMTLAENAKEKSVNFVARGVGDDLYSWSSLRSEYLADANNQIAGEYAGVSNFNPGWYWDPMMFDYTFIGMDPYWSPFGFGFFPPWGWAGGYWGGYGGYYGAGYGGGGYYGGGYRGGGLRGPGGVHPPGRLGGGGGFHGGGGFGGGGGFHGSGGGGFGGGGGGFHGGGGGGFGGGGGGGGGHR